MLTTATESTCDRLMWSPNILVTYVLLLKWAFKLDFISGPQPLRVQSYTYIQPIIQFYTFAFTFSGME